MNCKMQLATIYKSLKEWGIEMNKDVLVEIRARGNIAQIICRKAIKGNELPFRAVIRLSDGSIKSLDCKSEAEAYAFIYQRI